MAKEKKGLTEEEIREAVGKAEFFGISQKLVLLNETEKKFLLIRNAEIDKWEFPGGIVDREESLEDALKREAAEEVGEIEFESRGVISRLLTTYNVPTLKRRYPVVVIGYLASYLDGDVKLGNEHTEYKWMTADEVEKEMDENLNVGVKQFISSAVAKMKSDEYLNDLKRLQADFENYKKRQTESQKELGGYLIEKLLFDIIPVLDNFRMATGHVPEEAKGSPWVTGIQYIEKQLEDVLKSHGVEVVEVKEGDAFDPSIHEAIDSQQSTDNNQQKTEVKGADPKQEVVAIILQNGYRIGGRVVRPAKVTVK